MNEAFEIEEVIKNNGMYVSTVSGYSMSPFLKDRRDTVVILPPPEKIKKYDVVLYRYKERYVLHRVVRVRGDELVMCGDNRTEREYGITVSEIIGVLSEVYRGDKKVKLNGVGYQIYKRCAVLGFYPRRLWRTFKGFCGRKKREREKF